MSPNGMRPAQRLSFTLGLGAFVRTCACANVRCAQSLLRPGDGWRRSLQVTTGFCTFQHGFRYVVSEHDGADEHYTIELCMSTLPLVIHP